jgi:hypothetical protein
MATFSHFDISNLNNYGGVTLAVPFHTNAKRRHPIIGSIHGRRNIVSNFANPSNMEPIRGGDMLCAIPTVAGTVSESSAEMMQQDDSSSFLSTSSNVSWFTQAQDACHHKMENEDHHLIHRTLHERNNYKVNDRAVAAAGPIPSTHHQGTGINFSTCTQPMPFIPLQDTFSTINHTRDAQRWNQQHQQELMANRSMINKNAASELISLCRNNNTLEFFSICTKIGFMLLACFSSCEMTKSRWGLLIICCMLFFKTPS